MTATATEFPTHVLIAAEQEDEQTGFHRFDYQVECDADDPHHAACAMWVECACDPGEDPAYVEEEPCPTSPTGEHRMFSFGLAQPAGECIVADSPDLADAADDLRLTAPGRYGVGYDVEDEQYLYLHLDGSEPTA